MTSTSTAVRPVESVGSAAVARALPAWVYNHPALTPIEYERIIKPSWQIVCHVSSLARAGDYVTLDLGADSVIAVRTSRGDIQTLHNVCRHRGARILEGAGHCPGAITCPYHGWSYRLSGELLAITARETFPAALDKTQLGLKSVRSEIWNGFVFVCLAGNTRPLAEIWAGVAGEFAPHRFAEMQPLGPAYLEHWDCDWKVAMDNYLESYHVPIGHPGLNRMFTPDYDDQVNFPGVARGISWLREQPSPRWSERLYQKLAVEVSAALPEAHRRRWSFTSMLPNLGIDVFPDQMDFFQVLPRGAGKCMIRGQSFALPDERREMRIARYLSARINRQVQREDEFLCRRVQQGLASGSYEPGPLSRLENCMFEFHEQLRERIPELREKSPPARFS